MFNNQNTFSVRIHGFGGQGIKSLASILAEAAIASGLYAQAFPEFGPERRGAPVKAYGRFSLEPIMTRAQIEKPDVIIVLDPNAFRLGATLEGVGEKTQFILNTSLMPVEAKETYGLDIDHHQINCVDAASLVSEHGNKVHLSIPIIGRFIRTTELVPLDKVKETITQKFLEKIGEEKTRLSEKVLEEAYYQV
jgi:2-oxoacid:acceptor oxidoreductase gamma subunit (pyruvate/2-ketoisovalerate family)